MEGAALSEGGAYIKRITETVVGRLESQASVSIPDWARDAIDAAVKAGYIDTPDGGSVDYRRSRAG